MLSLCTSQVAHQAGAYPASCSIKRRGVFLPYLPGWDASPSQGYPQALNLLVPIYTPGWREALWELSVLPKNTTHVRPESLSIIKSQIMCDVYERTTIYTKFGRDVHEITAKHGKFGNARFTGAKLEFKVS